MKQADPHRDYRTLVRIGYDRVAVDFNTARSVESADELVPLLDVLMPASTVLDLGCGTGVPIARALARSHTVIGVDLSGGQLTLAHQQVPTADLIHADMTSVSFRRASFDAVVSFYAMFHLPLAEHEPLIARISDWLKPSGYLLATFSPNREEGYTEEFFGTEMYWSNLSLLEYRALMKDNGFEILRERIIGHGYANQDAKPEHHPLILARKAR